MKGAVIMYIDKCDKTFTIDSLHNVYNINDLNDCKIISNYIYYMHKHIDTQIGFTLFHAICVIIEMKQYDDDLLYDLQADFSWLENDTNKAIEFLHMNFDVDFI